jgi:hypothetical protein
MKKLYLALAGFVLVGTAVGQEAISERQRTFPAEKISEIRHRPSKLVTATERGAKPFNYWVDPVGDVVHNKGIQIYPPASGNTIAPFTSVLFQDTTAHVSSSSGISYTWMHGLGSVLDPKSTFLLANPDGTPSAGGAGPIVTVNDSYDIDSIDIYCWYKKKKPAVTDTLIVYVTWSTPYDTAVFRKLPSKNLWLDPLGGFRDSSVCPRIKPYGVNKPGNLLITNAPATNHRVVKYALQDKDVSTGGSKDVYIEFNPKITIPAGNIVSCQYAFIPAAGSYTPGDVVYEFSGATSPQVSNGFGAWVWEDKNQPALKDSKDYLIDPTNNNNTGATFAYYDRYPTTALVRPILRGSILTAPGMAYHITGVSTVGINDLSADGNFSLGQNAPNPFSNETTIAYQLKTAAKNVSLVIYNVAGVKLFERAQTNLGAGKYSIEVNNENFASGVYFYSLNVDGNQITKKMVVTE